MAEQNAEEIRFLGDVQRLALQPGDVLVLSCPVKLSDAAVASISEVMTACFPNHKGIILQDGMQIGVIGAEPRAEFEVRTADGQVVRRLTVD